LTVIGGINLINKLPLITLVCCSHSINPWYLDGTHALGQCGVDIAAAVTRLAGDCICRLLLYHTHSMRKPPSYFMEPVPLPVEDLGPPPDKLLNVRMPIFTVTVCFMLLS